MTRERSGLRPSSGVVLFAVTLFVYLANLRAIASHDTWPSRLLPLSLLESGSLDLDRFEVALPKTQEEGGYFYARSRGGHLVSIYPVVVPLLATPFFVPLAIHAEREPLGDERLLELSEATEKLAASVLAALSVVLVRILAGRFADGRAALLLTIAYALGTGTWVTSSQALWSHGPAELFLAALLLLVLRPALAAAGLAGACAGLLTVLRAPHLALAAAGALVVLVREPRRLPAYLLPAAGIVALSLAYNLSLFGTLLGGYGELATQELFHFDRRWALGLGGLLVSPARGLLVFSPFFLFVAAPVRSPVPAELRTLLAAFVPAALAELLFDAAFWGWSGGDCFGPRLLVDLMPVAILALVPAVSGLRTRPRAVFAALVAFSVGVQAIGALCFPLGDSASPRDVWKLSSLQYARALRGALVAHPEPRRLLCGTLAWDVLTGGEPCTSE